MYERLTSSELTNAPVSQASTDGGEPAAEFQRSNLGQRQEQFAALATSVAGALYVTALRYSGNHAHAEDLVQETHLRAWRNFDHFAIGTCFGAWVFQILRFLVANRQKSLTTHQVTTDFQADESLLGGRTQAEKRVEPFDTDWEAVYPELVDDPLKLALDALTPIQRALALRIPLGGLSYRECAKELGIPIGTVMSRYARARTRLRKELCNNAARCRRGSVKLK
ncbi:MAG TPA: sigma-70 family RNA polymerase sigma factor [Planctomycetota bacterium]|jgi:RNA polymerase sigma-70 factor (ECF subfamily)